MRAATLTVLSLGTLFATLACDVEDDALDGASLAPDEPVTFRCLSGCLQSPYVGLFDISNMSEDSAVAATSPSGTQTVRWTAITKGANSYSEMRVTDLAKCEIRLANTAPWVGCEGAIIDLEITQGSNVTTGKIWIAGLTTDSNPTLNVYKYDIKGNLDPLTGAPSPHFEYPICPQGDDSTRTAVMLPNVQATWTVTNGDDGLGELVASTSTRFSLACNGYAQAKGYTRAKVLPATGGARNYGVANYNAITHAMRALFRKQGTTDQYDALTEHGTYVAIKDLHNDPPLFDELNATPPIIGYGDYLLESVYNGLSNVQLGRKGATCKKAYPNVPCSGEGELEFPYGIHRRPEYSPPMLEITGWSSLPDCDMNNLDDFGAVGVYEWFEGTCDTVQW